MYHSIKHGLIVICQDIQISSKIAFSFEFQIQFAHDEIAENFAISLHLLSDTSGWLPTVVPFSPN